MSLSPIPRVLSTFRRSRVRALLMGGQACILYGAAEFSRDVDLAVAVAPANLARLRAALDELQAEPVFFPPLSAGVAGPGPGQEDAARQGLAHGETPGRGRHRSRAGEARSRAGALLADRMPDLRSAARHFTKIPSAGRTGGHKAARPSGRNDRWRGLDRAASQAGRRARAGAGPSLLGSPPRGAGTVAPRPPARLKPATGALSLGADRMDRGKNGRRGSFRVAGARRRS